MLDSELIESIVSDPIKRIRATTHSSTLTLEDLSDGLMVVMDSKDGKRHAAVTIKIGQSGLIVGYTTIDMGDEKAMRRLEDVINSELRGSTVRTRAKSSKKRRRPAQ